MECGSGLRQRQVSCPEDNRCNPNEQPKTSEICKKPACIKWVDGPWSMCTKTCGKGYQLRYVKCVDVRTQAASDFCDKSKKPPHKKYCENQKCPSKGTGK